MTWPTVLILPYGVPGSTLRTERIGIRASRASLGITKEIPAGGEGRAQRECDQLRHRLRGQPDRCSPGFRRLREGEINCSIEIVVTYDVRDLRNQVTRDFVRASPFLSSYVSTTAHDVNISAKSHALSGR